jgi:pimeloyl-ACP methyl ester carboxylesterase
MSKVNVGGIEVAYDEAGTGPAVLLLHGFPFNRSLWHAQVEVLTPHFRVIAPDLRGHGETSVAAGSATMADGGMDRADGCAGIGQAALCGLSMGGYVALASIACFVASPCPGAGGHTRRGNTEERDTRRIGRNLLQA